MKVLYFLAGVFIPLVILKLCYAVGTICVLPKTKGALFVSTSRRKIKAVLEAVPLSPKTRLVDLGCGDGRFLRAAYRRYGTVGVGYEINPWAYFLAKFYNFLSRCPARIMRKNFMQEDLSSYEVIFCYLFPDLLLDLAPKLRKEARPGTMVISANFPFPHWKPEKVLHVDDPVYIYRL